MMPAIKLQLWGATLGVFVILGFAMSHVATAQPVPLVNSSPVEGTDITKSSQSITFLMPSPSCRHLCSTRR